jgi:putative inorganic carbon (HCO3(-)) transporter
MAKVRENKILLGLINFSSFLILFTPLIVSSSFYFPFVGPKSLFFMGLAEVIFFSWLILIFIDPRYRPKFNLLLLALIFYLLIFILASIFGVNPSYSFWSKHERMTGILMQLHLFGFFLVLSSTFNKEDFKNLFSVSIFVAILAGFSAILSIGDPTRRGGGPLGNESFLGTYLLFNIFFALYLYFSSLDWKKNFGLISFFILSFFLLLAGVNLKGQSFLSSLFLIFYKSGARAAKISLYGAIFLLFLLWLISQKKKSFKILGFLILIPSFILISFALYSIMFQPSSFFRQLIEKEVGSFGGRFYVWEIARKGFLERPWLGWGPENFEFAFLKNYNPCFGTEECGGDIWYDRAHNVIFDTLSTTGILGLISYFFLFFASFYILWKNYLANKINFWPAGIFTSLLCAHFIQNLTVFDMVSSYMVFFLSLAFIASLEKEKESPKEIKKPNILISIFISILFFICFFEFVILPIKSSVLVISTVPRLEIVSSLQTKENSFILVPQATTTNGVLVRKYLTPEKRIQIYQEALKASPLGKYQIREFFAENSIQFFMSDAIGKVSLEEAKKEFDFLVSELEKTIKENPIDFRAHLKLGEVLNLYSQIDKTKTKKAEEVLRKAIELSPKNQQGYWQLAQNMIFQNRFDEAIDLAQRAVNLEPKLEKSHYILIKFLKIVGKEDLAKQKLEEAIKINPNWKEDLEKAL